MTMTKTQDSPPDGNENGEDGEDALDAAERLVTQRHYDPDDAGDLTATIIGAVADAKDVEMTAVTDPVLYDAVDAEALELSLFDDSEETLTADLGQVEFDYHGFTITVGSDGWVKVYEDFSD